MAIERTEKDLEYFLNRDYGIILRKRGDDFVLHIPELGILKKDENLENAYKKLEIEKEKYFQGIIDYNLQDTIIAPGGSKSQKTLFDSLLLFSIKLVIIILVIAISMQFALNKVSSKFTTQRLLTTAKNVALTMNKEISDMPDERKEALRIELRETIKNIKPFVDEFKLLFEDAGPNKKAYASLKNGRNEKVKNP